VNDSTEVLLDRMEDLYTQATTERSHYYVASILRDAMMEIIHMRVVMARCADSIRDQDETSALRMLEVCLLRIRNPVRSQPRRENNHERRARAGRVPPDV
jgi:hypothetical protein